MSTRAEINAQRLSTKFHKMSSNNPKSLRFYVF